MDSDDTADLNYFDSVEEEEPKAEAAEEGIDAKPVKSEKKQSHHYHQVMAKTVTGLRETNKQNYLFVRKSGGNEPELEKHLYVESYIPIPSNAISTASLRIGAWVYAPKEEWELLWLDIDSKDKKLAWVVAVGNESRERPSYQRLEFNMSAIKAFELNEDSTKITLTLELREPPRFSRGIRAIRGTKWVVTKDFTEGQASSILKMEAFFERCEINSSNYEKLLSILRSQAQD